MSMKPFNSLPEPVHDVITILNANAHEAFLVGGCVRDALLGRTVHDYDIATDALPQQIMAIFSGYCRIVSTGIRHGTVTLIHDGEAIEVTTYRIEQEYRDHRHPAAVSFTTDLLRDLGRRDFTINAMAMHPKLGIIDPFHGQEDLRAGIIRCVGDPARRLQEDALRILRAVRFSCTLHFRIEALLRYAIMRNAGLLAHISAERITKELCLILMSEQPHILCTLRELNLLRWTFPQVLPLIRLAQPSPWHIHDVFHHTDIALDHSRGYSLNQKLALVFHDCGKALTRTTDAQGHAHFKGHAQHSAAIAETALRQLRFPVKDIRIICTLIRFHDCRLRPDARELRHFLAKSDADYSFCRQLLQIQRADDMAKNPVMVKIELARIRAVTALLDQLEQQRPCLTLKQLALCGDDLMKLGLRGKAIGTALDALLDHVLDQPQDNDKKTLMRLAKQRISGSLLHS